ncbi:MAG: UDP-2,4-diacetamido-2,4,6-trideoxy-beta-L-altropyranose hydrolase [Thermodesulfobacteriota bacterium]
MTPAPRILIRTDATPAIGMGHLSRCLTLAAALIARGAAVELVMAEPSAVAAAKVAAAGAGLRPLPGGLPLAEDLAQTIEIIAMIGAAGAVLDGYQFDQAFLDGLSAAAPLLFFDELGEFNFACALVLNQNVHANDLAYRAGAETRLLLGPRYAVLRPEFAAARPAQRSHPDQAMRLFLNFGGSDPHDLTSRALAGLAASPRRYEIRAVLGGENRHAQAVLALAAESPHRVEVLRDVADMTAVMNWAHLALSASGTNTTLEMGCLGLPMIAVIQAENQRLIGEALGRQGLAAQLGFWSGVSGRDMAAAVDALAGDARRRRAMSAAAMAAVDGLGAGRVAEALLAACAGAGR